MRVFSLAGISRTLYIVFMAHTTENKMTTKSTRSMSANIKMEVETEFVTWTGLTGVAQQGMDSEGDERSDWYVVVTEDADGRAVIARTWEVILNDDMVMSFEEI